MNERRKSQSPGADTTPDAVEVGSTNTDLAADVGNWGPRNTAAVTIASGLSFEQIRHDFGGAPVLNGIDLAVAPGQVMCLLGPSGSGKTTLLRIAAGIERQTSGRVLLDGREIAGPAKFLPPEKRGIGLVFQDFALFPHMNILDNVKFGLTSLGAREANRQAMVVLTRVGMDGYAKEFPHALSGGEQQRVALARALAPRPGVLLMDEPFSGLDARLRDSVRDGTMELLRETRATAIIVTHDPEEALRMGDQIALMQGGKVVQSGDAGSLFYKPVNRFAAEFFSEVNVFDGVVEQGRVVTPIGPLPAQGLKNGVPVNACVRLSAVQVSDTNSVKGLMPARIIGRRFVGEIELIEMQMMQGRERLRARVPAGQIKAGVKDVFVTASLAGTMVFPA